MQVYLSNKQVDVMLELLYEERLNLYDIINNKEYPDDDISYVKKELAIVDRLIKKLASKESFD